MDGECLLQAVGIQGTAMLYPKLFYMARMKNHVLLSGVRGRIGELVIKQYADGIVISKVPDMSRVKKSKLQQQKQDHFKEAVAYAKSIVCNSQKKTAYAKKLKKGQSVYHAAIKEFMKKR